MNFVYPPPKVAPMPSTLMGLGRVNTGPRMVPMTADVLGAAPEDTDDSIPWGWIIAAILGTLLVVSLASKKPDVTVAAEKL